MRSKDDTLTVFMVVVILLGVSAFSALMHKVVNTSEPMVTWITEMPVDAGARKLSIGLRIDGVLVGALSTTASATINIKGEQTP